MSEGFYGELVGDYKKKRLPTDVEFERYKEQEQEEEFIFEG